VGSGAPGASGQLHLNPFGFALQLGDFDAANLAFAQRYWLRFDAGALPFKRLFKYEEDKRSALAACGWAGEKLDRVSKFLRNPILSNVEIYSPNSCKTLHTTEVS
jgi:hypothetical protein